MQELAPGLGVVLAPNPGLMTGPGTNQYRLGAGERALQIDCAALDDENAARLTQAGAPPAELLLTHVHPDHVGGAIALRQRHRTPIAVHASRAGVTVAGELLAPQRRLADGDVVPWSDGELVVVHTPGHESGHCCFWEPHRRWLFTGDTVLSTGTTVIAPPDGDMQAYLASLRRLRALEPAVIHPGHGPAVTDATALLDQYLAHRLAREAQVVDALRSGLATVEPIVARLYPELHQGLRWAAALTVQAHLDKLVADGVVVGHDGHWRLR